MHSSKVGLDVGVVWRDQIGDGVVKCGQLCAGVEHVSKAVRSCKAYCFGCLLWLCIVCCCLMLCNMGSHT